MGILSNPPDVDNTPMPASGVAGFLEDALRRYGLSVAISIYLIYFLTGQLSAAITAMHNDLTDHVKISAFFSRQICINTAPTEAAARACEPPNGIH